MNEISTGGVLVIAISSLLLFVAAAQKFNTPPTNRSGTTFALFYVGLLFYFFMLVAVWLCTMAFLASGGASVFHLELNEATKNILPLVAAIIVLVASNPSYEPIKTLEETARRICVRLASIPLFAEQLANELAHRARFRVVSERLKERVTEVISNNIGADAVNFRDDRSISSRFTRAIALYWLFIEPHNNGTPLEFPLDPSTKSAYSKTMELGEKTLSQANSHYEKLMEVGAAYFRSGVKPIRQVEDSLKKLTHEILSFICSLIARFVLLQAKTPSQRRSRLLSMGFDHYDELPILGATRWAILLLGIGIITIVLVIVTPRAVPLSKGEAFLRAVVFLMQIGISVAAGTFVAERFAKRQGKKRDLILVFELTVACLIVVTMSSALRIGGSLLSAALLRNGNGEFGEILSEFIDRWSVLIYPVANTISITFACSFLTELAWGRFGLVVLGAIFNGLVFVVAAFAAGMLLPIPVLTELNANMWMARLTVVLNSGLIGATVGGMVVAMFKRTRQIDNSQKLADAAGYEAARGWEPSPQKGEWAERPLGGYSRTNVEELVGTYVCFRPMFAEPDIVNAYLVKIQWDAKQSCLAFEETERADITFTQFGKIYIPDGKPFMNLVTAEKGDVRLITVSRPDPQGFARGLIMTLSVPGGVNFLPASGPIVLKKVGNQDIPKRGFVKPEHPDYNFYRSELLKVIPSFGVLAEPAMAPSLEVQG